MVQSRNSLFTVRGGRGNFCLWNHELAHQWLAFTGSPLSDGFHWQPGRLDRATSVLGDASGCLFNDLELYLAGLLPADSVASPLTGDGYSMEELVAALGPREPSLAEAPRDFTVGFIRVVTEPPTDHEMAYFHHLVGEYAAHRRTALGPNWWESTGARSRLSVERARD